MTGYFSDMIEFQWAREAVDALFERKIVIGKSDKMYAPGDPVTRAEFVKMVISALDIPLSHSKGRFTDVEDNQWYSQYINTAYETGLVKGVSQNQFLPEGIITREMAANILYNAALLKNINFSSKNYGFNDMASIEEYAVEAVAYLNGAMIISGFETGEFMPKVLCNRAQAAQLVYNVLKGYDAE